MGNLTQKPHKRKRFIIIMIVIIIISIIKFAKSLVQISISREPLKYYLRTRINATNRNVFKI